MAEQHKVQANIQAFNNNPLIQKLGREQNWVISDTNKAPLDMHRYLTDGTLSFAKPSPDWNPRVTLPELNSNQNLKFTNRAYHLNAEKNHVICIDIENTITEPMKTRLLQLPFQYLEYSTHLGFHGLLYVDDKYINRENEYLFDITNLKIPNRTWEVILNNHYCTFTQDVIEPIQMDEKTKDNMMINFLNYLVQIDQVNQKARYDRQQALNVKSEIPERINKIAKLFPESDFKNIARISPDLYVDNSGQPDMSRYEFNICKLIRKQIASRLIYGFVDPFSALTLNDGAKGLSADDYVYLTYYFAQKIIPHRDKHDTQRDGLPYLLYTCSSLSDLSDSEIQTLRKNVKYGPEVIKDSTYEKFYS